MRTDENPRQIIYYQLPRSNLPANLTRTYALRPAVMLSIWIVTIFGINASGNVAGIAGRILNIM